ncbi:MAG TPA: alpha/beta fold hydrolase [Candidatus Baltobacteraceae bacterium]|nr:alpha/beta fold hydrolase [Candidatus Baltobacteraceae bacterium]
MRIILIALLLAANAMMPAAAATYPPPHGGTYVIPSFAFEDGETMTNLRLHYETFGTPRVDASGRTTNAVLIIHGTGGSAWQFINDRFAGVLFVPGGILDANKYFIILPDEIGHGESSKPSDGLRARFPHYGYHDMVRATHELLVDGLHVNHLRLVMGTSMGGMQTWMWGEMYPTMMDALVPLASLPIQISGRNRIWRKMIADLITSSPDYDGGNYTSEPYGMKGAADLIWMVGSAPLYDQSIMPTQQAADAYYDSTVAPLAKRFDANDLLYQIDASSDYDPQPLLGSIVAPLLAINSADDQINPPELGILQREIKKVPHGRYVLLPITAQTRGHGTHTLPAVWGAYLAAFMKQTER